MSDDQRKADEAREQAGEKSLRPDIQGGAMQMAEEAEEEPETHEHPSLREAADETDEA